MYFAMTTLSQGGSAFKPPDTFTRSPNNLDIEQDKPCNLHLEA